MSTGSRCKTSWIRQPRLFHAGDDNLESDDYFTPPWLFERMALEFDLDVCAPSGGVPWVPAAAHLTEADDALAVPWFGRVWMNPPYSNPTPWIERFIEHRHGVSLVPHSRARWHSALWGEADAMADPTNGSPDGAPLRFWRDGRSVGIYMPVVLAAFGEECVEAISRVGPTRVIR